MKYSDYKFSITKTVVQFYARTVYSVNCHFRFCYEVYKSL